MIKKSLTASIMFIGINITLLSSYSHAAFLCAPPKFKSTDENLFPPQMADLKSPPCPQGQHPNLCLKWKDDLLRAEEANRSAYIKRCPDPTLGPLLNFDDSDYNTWLKMQPEWRRTHIERLKRDPLKNAHIKKAQIEDRKELEALIKNCDYDRQRARQMLEDVIKALKEDGRSRALSLDERFLSGGAKDDLIKLRSDYEVKMDNLRVQIEHMPLYDTLHRVIAETAKQLTFEYTIEREELKRRYEDELARPKLIKP